MSDVGKHLAKKGKGRLGAVQAARPAAERGRIGHAVRIFKRRRRLFPGTMFRKAAPQCVTARQQTIVCVRQRKQWEKGEGLPTPRTTATADVNPVVMRVVRLLAAASMADDRIAVTSGASSQDDFGAARGPISFKLVRKDAKWDKQNRRS